MQNGREHILTMTLPIGPSANHSFGVNLRAKKGKRIYITRAAKDYLNLVEGRTKKNLPEDWDSKITKDFWIVIELYHFNKGNVHSGDLSNRHQTILNGIKNGLGIDDYFFLVRDMSRELDRDNPRIIVNIYKENRNVVDLRRRRSRRKN